MSEATDTTPAPEPKRRGRPASGQPTQTAAERQRAYRQRVKMAAHDAQGQIKPLGRVALVKMLSEDLAVLDDAKAPATDKDRANWNVGRILREIVTRYGIKPE